MLTIVFGGGEGKNNSYLCKRKQAGGVQFSRDPLNLTNKHSRKHAGFVNEKAIGIQPDSNTVCPSLLPLPRSNILLSPLTNLCLSVPDLNDNKALLPPEQARKIYPALLVLILDAQQKAL